MFTIQDIETVQRQWADGVIEIGRLKNNFKHCREAAVDFLSRYYAYDKGEVLFKPTLASRNPFRLSKEAALSYFIGGNPEFSEDKGFALRPWASIKFSHGGVLFYRDTAAAMGEYTFITAEGMEVLAEYTFGYRDYGDAQPRIYLHHSSLPYK
ncbi:MAG: hypothetical protein B0D92_02010 [Spirochaeta sp. LUC14_002_19_P3]|nr:MAG: hypothetical protein B0D92_02010 [Spirochaeta sp. LUC14_002_19_P3]